MLGRWRVRWGFPPGENGGEGLGARQPAYKPPFRTRWTTARNVSPVVLETAGDVGAVSRTLEHAG